MDHLYHRPRRYSITYAMINSIGGGSSHGTGEM